MINLIVWYICYLCNYTFIHFSNAWKISKSIYYTYHLQNCLCIYTYIILVSHFVKNINFYINSLYWLGMSSSSIYYIITSILSLRISNIRIPWHGVINVTSISNYTSIVLFFVIIILNEKTKGQDAIWSSCSKINLYRKQDKMIARNESFIAVHSYSVTCYNIKLKNFCFYKSIM